MEIVLNKEDFLNGIKVVKNITSSKGVQPVLSNILIETITSDRVMFVATDLNLGISFKLTDAIKDKRRIKPITVHIVINVSRCTFIPKMFTIQCSPI